MDTLKTITTRKSIRAYTNQDVSNEQICTLLKAMIASPSAGNRQPWRIYVVRDEKIQQKLASGAHDQEFIMEAPVVFVVCRVPDESGVRYQNRGRLFYSIQDTAAMTQNLLLAAHAVGLGSCWVGAFNDSAIATALDCPPEVLPVAIIPVGYPAESPGPRGRRSLDSVVHFLPPKSS